MQDIPFLVFGGKEGEIELRDAFAHCFGTEHNLRVWKRIGAAPLTRQCLLDEKVRHEIVRDAQGVIDVDTDPKVARVLEFVAHNTLCCDLLLGEGFDGDRFRMPAVTKQGCEQAPPRSNQATLR
jgi:hypothetical protein